MIKKQFFICFILLVCLIPRITSAQTNEILVGHKMPEVKFDNILNYTKTGAKLSDFEGKLLILDFWATYCAPCITMFGKTDSLEKAFQGKVKFLSVTKEPEGKVKPFLDRLYRAKKITPTSVVKDTLLSKYFYYSSIPYYVWINEKGKVIATTDASEITFANIQSVLKGLPTTFQNRTDIRRKPIDNIKSLFVVNDNFILKDSTEKREEVSRENILSYSIATRWIDNAHGGFAMDSAHFNAFNTSIDYLYRKAYDLYYYSWPLPGAFDSQTTHAFEMSDSLLNMITVPDNSPINGNSTKTLEWGKKNGVCYEIIFPKDISWHERISVIKSDLDRYFADRMGFSVAVEKRIDSNTTVLKIIGDEIKLTTSNEKSFEHHDRYSYRQRSAPLKTFITTLNSYFLQGAKTTVIDKTFYKNKVDIDLNCDMSDIKSLNIELKKYGLCLVKEPVPIDVLVFKELKKGKKVF